MLKQTAPCTMRLILWHPNVFCCLQWLSSWIFPMFFSTEIQRELERVSNTCSCWSALHSAAWIGANLERRNEICGKFHSYFCYFTKNEAIACKCLKDLYENEIGSSESIPVPIRTTCGDQFLSNPATCSSVRHRRRSLLLLVHLFWSCLGM